MTLSQRRSIVSLRIGDVLPLVVLQHHSLVAQEGDHTHRLVVVDFHTLLQISVLQCMAEPVIVVAGTGGEYPFQHIEMDLGGDFPVRVERLFFGLPTLAAGGV